MQGSKIEIFENSIPEELLLKGEELLDQDATSLHTIIDKNLYIFWSKDQQKKYESEILLSGHTIKSYSCDCEDFKSEQNCAHVVCSAFVLRQIKSPKSPVKQDKQKKKKSNFNVDDVLRSISHEELKNFIKGYSKRDQKFNLTLKANFARRIPNIDPETKYQNLLDNIIKPIRNVESKYAASSISQYLKLAKELHAQMKDSISLEQFTEAFYILKNLLQKTAYAITNAKSRSEKLFEFYEKLHQEIDLLYSIDLAPELKENLSDFLLQTLSYSYYVFPTFKQNIPRKIIQYASNVNKTQLGEILNQRFKYSHEKEEVEMILALEILTADYNEDNFNHIFPKLRTDLLKNVLNYLLREQRFTLLNDFIEIAREQKHLANFPYDDVLIVVAEKKQDYPLLSEALYQKYLHTRNQKFLNALLAIDPQFSQDYLHQAAKLIKARKSHGEYLVDIAFVLKDYQQMITEIDLQDNFDRLNQYFDDLIAIDPQHVDYLLHQFLNKAKSKINYYHRNIRTLKNIFLNRDYPQKNLWETLFSLAEDHHNQQMAEESLKES